MLTFKPTILPNESLSGYFLRLAEDNHIEASSALLRVAGVRQKATYTQAEIQKVAETYELDLYPLKEAGLFNALKGGLGKGKFLRKSIIPVCPSCLADHPYIRQEWHHELVTACPVHRLTLFHACPECLAPIDLRRCSLCACQTCGLQFSAMEVDVADNADLLIAEIITGRTGRPAWPYMTDVPEDIDSFLVYLANLSLTAPHRKNAAISFEEAQEINQACFLIIEDLYANFCSFVRERVAIANRQASGRFIKNLGGWYKRLSDEFPGSEYKALRDAVHLILLQEAQAPINRKMKQIGSELLGKKSMYTASEAARILRSSPDRVVALVKSDKLKGAILDGVSNQFCLVDRHETERELAAAQLFIDGKEVMRRLVITRKLRDRLIGSGVLRRVSNVEKPLFAKGDFQKIDVDGLLEKLADGVAQSFASSITWSLEEINRKRFSADQTDELFRLIFAGHIRPVARDPEIKGIGSFRFDPTAVKAAVISETNDIGFTITDIVKATRWKHESIKSWIDLGLLGCRREWSGRTEKIYVSLQDVIEFLSRYSVAADAATRLNSRSVWVCSALKAKGVMAEDTFLTSEGTLRGCLINIDALINVASGRAPSWVRPDSIQKRQALEGEPSLDLQTTS